jgi:hypothetical protein
MENVTPHRESSPFRQVVLYALNVNFSNIKHNFTLSSPFNMLRIVSGRLWYLARRPLELFTWRYVAASWTAIWRTGTNGDGCLVAGWKNVPVRTDRTTCFQRAAKNCAGSVSEQDRRRKGNLMRPISLYQDFREEGRVATMRDINISNRNSSSLTLWMNVPEMGLGRSFEV